MAPVTPQEESIILLLAQTRSVGTTASRLHLPLGRVQRVAMMAYGLGHLDVDLVDY